MTQRTLKNIAGQRFGSMVAIEYAGYRPGGGAWLCRCDCGVTKEAMGAALRAGRIKSCGCKTGELIAAKLTRHGDARGGKVANEHAIWRRMIGRCENPNSPGYADYGGRGINVCERWHQYENFLADMGRRPNGKSLDRFPNNDGNYEPGNCRWATPRQQANNRRKRRWWKRPAP